MLNIKKKNIQQFKLKKSVFLFVNFDVRKLEFIFCHVYNELIETV